MDEHARRALRHLPPDELIRMLKEGLSPEVRMRLAAGLLNGARAYAIGTSPGTKKGEFEYKIALSEEVSFVVWTAKDAIMVKDERSGWRNYADRATPCSECGMNHPEDGAGCFCQVCQRRHLAVVECPMHWCRGCRQHHAGSCLP